MKNYWKRFGAWAIGSEPNLFERARFKLTALYVSIIIIILIIFSLILYFSIAKNIRGNLEGEFSDNRAQELIIAKTVNDLRATIFLIDFVILFISSGLSYFLAGETLKPIQVVMAKQKQFIADASHEFRTPLAVMQTNLEIAAREKEWDQKKSRELILSTIDEVKLMTKLTKNLLTLLKFESKDEIYVFSRINLVEIIAEVVAKMRNIAIKNQIQLSTVRSTPALIEGDAEAIRELITNIISNGLNFTPAGGFVRITVDCRDGKALVGVQDTGVGIAKEDLPHVFERLYRADKARSREDGSGLGLAIADEIARKHRGAITIKSEPGKGTLVTIILPTVT